MNWLQDLLTNPDSIAHIVALYSFVIAAGVLLGKIKVFWELPLSCSSGFWPGISDLPEMLPSYHSFRTSD